MISVLQARNIVKVYPGTVALDDVSVTFEGGKVHALVGKNGSGKSTLLKIISGAEQKTEGSLFLDGKELNIKDTQSVLDLGIATVYQEMSVLPFLSVAENIYLSHLPVKKSRTVDWSAVYSESQKLLDELGIDIDPHAKVESLSIGQQQMVEIAKAMSTNPKVIQFDEPTSAITSTEVEALFKVIRRLKEKDVIIVYVSHRMHELWEIADVCTVLRDGRYVGTKQMKELSHQELIHMMFGDVEIKSRPQDLQVKDRVVLEASNISYKDKVHDVSFQLKEGEILGIAGMLGSGRTELLSCVFGALPADQGEVRVFDKVIQKRAPATMKQAGVAMTTEDRKTYGLVLFQSIQDNLVRSAIDTTGNGFLYSNAKAHELAQKQEKELNIKIGGLKFPVSSLSGGNQQKVVVGNWLNTEPRIMLFDEPSRGIDVSAKQQIFQIMWDQSRKGISSVMVSTELEELLEVCHRILVIKDGKIIREITRPEDYTIEDLYTVCMGGTVLC